VNKRSTEHAILVNITNPLETTRHYSKCSIGLQPRDHSQLQMSFSFNKGTRDKNTVLLYFYLCSTDTSDQRCVLCLTSVGVRRTICVAVKTDTTACQYIQSTIINIELCQCFIAFHW